MRQITLAVIAVFILAIISLFVGVSNVTPQTLFSNSEDGRALQVLLASRIPRTLAIILAGSSMAVAGMIVQILARNNYVSPSTVGTVESAGLGLLVIMIFAPDLPIIAKMLVATAFALCGTSLFLLLLSRIPLRSVLVVPLIGIMFGGVIGAITTFFAYRLSLLQSLNSWMTGSFSGILRGRYELLWISFALALIAFVAADRFTVAGMGRDFTTNLGLNYRRVMVLGLTIVSMVTSVVVVTVGTIPFLGLIVPNVVRLIIGDNVRIAVPWIAVGGAGFVLICDIIGRLVIYPYEIPIGVVIGVIGSFIFLTLILRRDARVA